MCTKASMSHAFTLVMSYKLARLQPIHVLLEGHGVHLASDRRWLGKTTGGLKKMGLGWTHLGKVFCEAIISQGVNVCQIYKNKNTFFMQNYFAYII